VELYKITVDGLDELQEAEDLGLNTAQVRIRRLNVKYPTRRGDARKAQALSSAYWWDSECLIFFCGDLQC